MAANREPGKTRLRLGAAPVEGRRLDDHGFRAEIVRAYPELTPQQRQVADFLLGNLDDALLLSLPEIAERSGISEATIFRFAQRLGYSGFGDLRLQFLEILRGRVQRRSPDTPPAPSDDLVGAVVHRELDNVRRTFDKLDMDRFHRAAQLLFAAEHVLIFGLGISSILADLAHYWLVHIGLRAFALSSGFSNPAEQLLSFDKRDLFLTFSFPPYSKQTIEMVEQAKLRKLKTLVITDRLTSPAGLSGTLALTVHTENVIYSNAVGAAAVLLNALITDIALRLQGKSLSVLREVTRLVELDASKERP
jgi:DNA-binding MurR/RpiR family transcriptional regulator